MAFKAEIIQSRIPGFPTSVSNAGTIENVSAFADSESKTETPGIIGVNVMGLGEDLKMEGDDFAWSGTAFYLGYLILEFPSVYLLSTLLSSKLCLDPWGIIVALPGES
ncbi:hypothetical protein B0I72DRAFT_145399 [Yarrowia lipolytica]|nr:hypothetical protein BKA91DRAFT_148248 [Yarrowia lipolytica]KAE8170177.1 hypothetical protein BKA90DRAFT_148725 [Yarrowia lipolytica]RDW33978.1 hypothetical protein B0I72DRAFT_145399 [Yarrowia lipolytica]RDW36917.1 hypothetical protein B0I73DRAFT_149626 [Yarrowia lipolytica]RDW44639.1 hypothetical protein B0I74DRAFT_147693 [Yarrowia lipolytica]